MFRAAIAILTLTLSSLPAFAADTDRDQSLVPPSAAERPSITSVPAHGAEVNLWQLPVPSETPSRRPSILPALYVSLAGLQAFDAYSTREGLMRGAHESNMLMRGVVGNRAAFWTVKAGTTAVSVVLAERMWRKNRKGAIALLVLANGISAAVAVNNARVLRQQR